jgi:proteasome alpha subunit
LLVNHIRINAQQHRVTYDTPVDVEVVIREAADIKQQYTQHPGIRPFGVSLMIAGVSSGVPKLYTSEITGNYLEYTAAVIGKNDEKIKEILREKYKKEITIDEAIKLGIGIFKDVLEDKFDVRRLNVGFIKSKDAKLKKLSKEEIQKFI